MTRMFLAPVVLVCISLTACARPTASEIRQAQLPDMVINLKGDKLKIASCLVDKESVFHLGDAPAWQARITTFDNPVTVVQDPQEGFQPMVMSIIDLYDAGGNSVRAELRVLHPGFSDHPDRDMLDAYSRFVRECDRG
jgi:hypothetical protein